MSEFTDIYFREIRFRGNAKERFVELEKKNLTNFKIDNMERYSIILISIYGGRSRNFSDGCKNVEPSIAFSILFFKRAHIRLLHLISLRPVEDRRYIPARFVNWIRRFYDFFYD